ncbi:hypothetical protein LguiA_009233 [Lonicera macranthoides]
MASSKSISIATLVWRILALLCLVASIAVMATNNFTLDDGTKTKFTDIITYRYVIATASVACLYILIQMPFIIYYLCIGKRMIRNECLPEFDFYGDKFISFLLATGAGAGFFVTYEFLKVINVSFDALVALGVEGLNETKTFLHRGYISTGLLFLGFICMAVCSVLSSIARSTATSSSGKGGFFFFH